jgi:mRNA interferase RelE/StbE
VAYQLVILRRAQKELAKIPEPDYGRVTTAIQSLAAVPRPSGCTKLTGRDAWRIRVGQYRVIYEITDTACIVTVVDVGNRRDIYR